jgi:bisphosphoglycerate-independent phosphoglycerate mutase (AlkP superfamily)
MNIFEKKPNICEAVPFIYGYARKSKRSERYKGKYRCLAKVLESFEENRAIKIMSNTFTEEVCEDFVYYLKQRNLARNTVRNYLSETFFMFRKIFNPDFGDQPVASNL